jgi:hypothetical protein
MVRRWVMSRFDGSAFMAISLVPPVASRLQTSWPTVTVARSSGTGMPSLLQLAQVCLLVGIERRRNG